MKKNIFYIWQKLKKQSLLNIKIMEFTTLITAIWIFWILGFLVFDKFFSKKWENFEEKLEKEIEKIEEKNLEIQNELKNKIAELEWERRVLSEENIRTKVELDKKNEIFWEKENQIKQEVEEKNIAQWKAKQMFAEFAPLKEKYSNLQEKNDELTTKIAKLEAELEQEKTKKTKDFERKLAELEESRKALEDEKARIRKEDEEKKLEEEKNRDRIWAEHEINSISKMKEVCKKPDFNFNFYENITLPESFDGKFKPDFLVEFLGQYIIFDAKLSKSKDIQGYINEQVKSTVKKIKSAKNCDEIYKTVYFIVPTQDFIKMKKISFYEDWYNLFAISIESFESILASFKKISEYENLEKIDPQERENIINVLAAYDQHISHRNAIDILSSLQWLKVSKLKNELWWEMLDEIEDKKSKIRLENFKPTDLKKFIQDPKHQIDEIKKIILPKKAEIDKKEIEQIEII